MADGTLRDYSGLVMPCWRTGLTTSDTTNYPDIIVPPAGAKVCTVIPVNNELSVQVEGITQDTARDSALADLTKCGPLVADIPSSFPINEGQVIAIWGAVISTDYTLGFYGRGAERDH